MDFLTFGSTFFASGAGFACSTAFPFGALVISLAGYFYSVAAGSLFTTCFACCTALLTTVEVFCTALASRYPFAPPTTATFLVAGGGTFV